MDGKRARGGGYIAEPLGDRRRFVPSRFKVKGLLTAPLVTLGRRLLPLMDQERPPTIFPALPTSFQQVQFVDTFQEVVLQLLWLENVFHFSQSTFNLALTIFHRLLVSVKVGRPLRAGDRLRERRLSSAPLAAPVDEPSRMLKPK